MIRTRKLENYISYVQIERLNPVVKGELVLVQKGYGLNYAAFGKVVSEGCDYSGKVVLYNALTAKKVSVLGQDGHFVRESEILCEVVVDERMEFEDNGIRYKLEVYKEFDVSAFDSGNNVHGQASRFSI